MKKIIAGIGFELTGTLMLLCSSLIASMSMENTTEWNLSLIHIQMCIRDRDTSKKIKAVLKSRGSSGNAHTSNIPPYGYQKDPENPDHWIIDEEAAEVVRRIYRMTIEGKGPYQIARDVYKRQVHGGAVIKEIQRTVHIQV